MADNSKPTVLLGIRITEDMKTRLAKATGKAAYDRESDVSLSGLVREILDAWLRQEGL
jgi:hypothetical protein